MTTGYTDINGRHYFSKGALEKVIEMCTMYMNSDGSVVQITKEHIMFVENAMLAMAERGLRVLALAYKQDTQEPTDSGEYDNIPRFQVEHGFVFVGLIGMYDPPRVESCMSVRECQRAGIQVHMATGTHRYIFTIIHIYPGDHPKTASSIAKEIGILQQEDDETHVMTAQEFDGLSNDEIDSLVQLPKVLARCSPNTKVRLVQALHRRNKYVAMTGDGVNDAPAVSEADIGIAMGISGSDVTKQASSITLTDGIHLF